MTAEAFDAIAAFSDTPNSVFGTEFRTYRECRTDKVRLR